MIKLKQMINVYIHLNMYILCRVQCLFEAQFPYKGERKVKQPFRCGRWNSLRMNAWKNEKQVDCVRIAVNGKCIIHNKRHTTLYKSVINGNVKLKCSVSIYKYSIAKWCASESMNN